MIRALSPYYVDTNLTYTPSGGSLTTCETFTLNIWVWDGLKASPDSTNSYQITYQNTSDRTDSHKINVSPMVRDYIDFTQPSPLAQLTTTGLINGNNQQWVYTYVTYDDDTSTKYNEATELMTLGYGSGLEGENYDTVSNNILLKPQDYKVYNDGIFIFPVLASETTDRIIVMGLNGTVIGPSFTFTVPATTDSSQMVQYLWVDLKNDFPLLERNDAVSLTYEGVSTTLVVEEECKYTPMSIMFQNKDGALQSFTFFKEQVDSMTVTDELFETNRGQASAGYHQFVRYNVQARSIVKASSGFIHERENRNIKQLLLSERVWLYSEEAPFYSPLNIKETNVSYKTRIKERLINYIIRFEMSFNEVNNI